jgi:hypothetical protein
MKLLSIESQFHHKRSNTCIEEELSNNELKKNNKND